MTKDEMLAELREVLSDTIEVYAWSDPLLLRYLEEGQDKFCADTGLFTDASTYTIELLEGVRSYALSPRIISVLDVYSGSRRLRKMQLDDIYYPHGDRVSIEKSFPPGAPSGWWADTQQGTITFDRTPTLAEVGTSFTLRVWRYSVAPLSAATTVSPELPLTLQGACIEWAAYKAFSHHDQEQQDPVKAADHKANYRGYVTEGKAYERRITSRSISIGGNPMYVV